MLLMPVLILATCGVTVHGLIPILFLNYICT